MKKLFISLVILLTFVSCTRVLDETSKYDKDCILLNIYNGPMSTKATNDGTEYERQIKRLDCFFYVKDALNSCVYYQKVTNTDNVTSRQEIPFFVDESTITNIFPNSSQCDVFVIANYPGNDDWSETYETTSVDDLKKIVLNLFDQEADGTYKHDAVNKPFVMSGFHIATKGDNNNATGTIPLVRAASKITIKLKIPEWLDVTETVGSTDPGNTETQSVQVRYFPVVQDADEKIPFETVFHYGVSKTYLNTDYNDKLVDGSYPDGDYFSSPVTSYKDLEEVTIDEGDRYYTCEIEVPFYSYARTWAKGANNAPYLTIKMPWKKTVDGAEIHNDYYYQILVNPGGLALTPNNWYDLTVNVGVLGSLTESLPTEIKSDDITYYILDWTKEPQQSEGDRYEDIVIKEYAYLQVPEKRIIISNTSVGYIPYDASHKIGWVMNTSSKTDEILGTTTSLSAFYIKCGSGSTSSSGGGNSGSSFTPVVSTLPHTLDVTNFNTTDKAGNLTYKYTITSDDKIYSPVFSYITIYLDIDGDDVLDEKEKNFTENVTIVQYPPIYIIPHKSVEKAILVNDHGVYGNTTGYGSTSTGNFSYNGYNLGAVSGSKTGGYMYTINVSELSANDKFSFGSITGNYIIGDPRKTEIDNDMNLTDNYDMTNNWVTAPAVYPNETTYEPKRKMIYYYPANSDPNSYQIIAPKFRISSSHSTVGGATNVHVNGAPLRCATYQEDGYPAGRWRVPTAAEIAFVQSLQKLGVIATIFVNDTYYFCSTGTVQLSGNSYSTTRTTGSVRCVYDEWYWGSEREAKRNPSVASDRAANSYLFTWGDEPMR